jgi:hypothetical protein
VNSGGADGGGLETPLLVGSRSIKDAL